MNIRNIRTVAISTLAVFLAAPVVQASATSATYSFRSDTNPPYWYQGVRSDAGDGYFGDGVFTGEAVAIVDGSPVYTGSTGPLGQCKVQLNRIVNGVASAMPGYVHTGTSLDLGRSCDAWGTWDIPAGTYNVTTSYTVNGRWVTTVQGPVSNYPGN